MAGGPISQRLREGREHHRRGALKEAEDCYRAVTEAEPQHADARYLLGLVKQQRGQHRDAVAELDLALRVAPSQAAFHFHRALSLDALGQGEAALAALDQAIVIKPRLAAAHTTRGNLLRRLGRPSEAVDAQRHAVELAPEQPGSWSNLALAYRDAGHLDRAVEALERAVTLAPHVADLHHNLGNVLMASDHAARAEASLREALRLSPKHARARSDLGSFLLRAGRLDEAIAELKHAVADQPGYAEAHWNLSHALIMAGELEQGFREYEWRLRIPGRPRRDPNVRGWGGGPLGADRLLVTTEQGLGDVLQFARFALPLRDANPNARLVLECHPPLVPLLGQSGLFDQVTAHGEPLPGVDRHVPLMSLPARLGAGADDLPGRAGYLAPDPDRVSRMRRRLDPEAEVHVGICFQGNPDYPRDGQRSIPLSAFAPLSGQPGVRLYSLQKHHGLDQVAAHAEALGLVDLGPELDRAGAFLDTAAVIANLDLLVCSDTSIAHLAGALGAPVWLALAHVPDFRWGTSGEQCPWYARMRLFRQPRPGDWAAVFAQMQVALKELRACPSHSRSALVS